VLVDPVSNKTRLVIELDDSSHLREDRQRRDGFVEAVLRAADAPLLRVRVPAQNRYDAAELARQIGQAMKG
jgi:very-short-patch-repair endonuclease